MATSASATPSPPCEQSWAERNSARSAPATRQSTSRSRALGAAEVQTVGDAERARPRAGDVAGGLRDGGLAPLIRIERDVASTAVGRDCDAELRAPHSDHTGVAPRGDHRARLDGRVVLLVYPALGGDGRVVEQREQYVRGRRERGD